MVQKQAEESVFALAKARHGTPVYDSEQVRLGVVTRIYWGADRRHPDSDDFETTFLGVMSLPPDAAMLIREEGCIRVDTGMLFGDYFVLPHQVAYLNDQGMFLHVRADAFLMF